MHIKLNFQVFIIMFLILVVNQMEIYVITLVSIAIHELAHILAGILLGYKIRTVKIMPLGFNILFKKSVRKTSKFDKIIIAIAGPMVNIIISIACLYIPINDYIKEMIIYANILLAVINLIPIFPLDGGRILKEVLSIKYNKLETIEIIEKVTYISIIAITIVSSIVILYFKNVAIFLGVLFLWWLVITEHRKNLYRKRAYEVITNKEICNFYKND